MSKWIVAAEWDQYETSVYEFDTYEEAKKSFDSYDTSSTEIDKIYIAQVSEAKGKKITE